MADTYRVLLTASRTWADPVAVRQQMAIAAQEALRAGKTPVLVHGQCDPRHPDTGRLIPWDRAKMMSWEVQGRYLGGDWLAEWTALSHAGMGWRIERHPADWEAPCRPECRPGHRRRRGRSDGYCPAAGNYRNAEMVDLGAHLCIALIRNGSRGATHCADLAEKADIPVRRFTA